jgi:hypothetical protein
MTADMAKEAQVRIREDLQNILYYSMPSNQDKATYTLHDFQANVQKKLDELSDSVQTKSGMRKWRDALEEEWQRLKNSRPYYGQYQRSNVDDTPERVQMKKSIKLYMSDILSNVKQIEQFLESVHEPVQDLQLNQYMVQTCAPSKMSMIVRNPDESLDIATDSSREFGIDVDVPVLDIRPSQFEDHSFRWDKLCFIRDEVELYKTTCDSIINKEDREEIEQQNIENLMILLKRDLAKLFRIKIEDVSTWQSIEWYEPTFFYQQHDIVLRTFDEEHRNFLEIRFKQDVIHVKIRCDVEFEIPNFEMAWAEWTQQRYNSLTSTGPTGPVHQNAQLLINAYQRFGDRFGFEANAHDRAAGRYVVWEEFRALSRITPDVLDNLLSHTEFVANYLNSGILNMHAPNTELATFTVTCLQRVLTILIPQSLPYFQNAHNRWTFETEGMTLTLYCDACELNLTFRSGYHLQNMEWSASVSMELNPYESD